MYFINNPITITFTLRANILGYTAADIDTQVILPNGDTSYVNDNITNFVAPTATQEGSCDLVYTPTVPGRHEFSILIGELGATFVLARRNIYAIENFSVASRAVLPKVAIETRLTSAGYPAGKGPTALDVSNTGEFYIMFNDVWTPPLGFSSASKFQIYRTVDGSSYTPVGDENDFWAVQEFKLDGGGINGCVHSFAGQNGARQTSDVTAVSPWGGAGVGGSIGNSQQMIWSELYTRWFCTRGSGGVFQNDPTQLEARADFVASLGQGNFGIVGGPLGVCSLSTIDDSSVLFRKDSHLDVWDEGGGFWTTIDKLFYDDTTTGIFGCYNPIDNDYVFCGNTYNSAAQTDRSINPQYTPSVTYKKNPGSLNSSGWDTALIDFSRYGWITAGGTLGTGYTRTPGDQARAIWWDYGNSRYIVSINDGSFYESTNLSSWTELTGGIWDTLNAEDYVIDVVSDPTLGWMAITRWGDILYGSA